MKQIEHLLRETIGLDAASIGSSLIERSIRARMRIRELVRKDDYLKLLRESPAELDTLIESVVVTETWFFRDRETFQTLTRLVFEEWLPAHPTGKLRLLSIPCSSGEEPYSMAMALLDAGLPAQCFHIDALDISARALASAKRAVYGRNSFRGQDLDFCARHFRASSDGHILSPSVRAQVTFRKDNLMNDGCLLGVRPYDFIFCRNLLIYLNGPGQTKVFQKLRQALAPPGTLFVGAAEVPLALEHGFVSFNSPLSFACRSSDSSGKSSAPRSRSKGSVLDRDLPKSLPLSPPQPAGARKLPANLKLPPSAVQPPADLEQARQLADEGRLAEAAEICETHIRERGVSAEAFYLLGLVRNAAGADAQAGEFYRKALYLEPDHYETLVQWASLSEKNGDDNHARILQKRAERVKKRT